MRVLHVIAEMDPKKGGVGQAVRILMKGLSDAGIRNEAVCLDDENAPFLKTTSLKIHALGNGKGPWSYNTKLFSWLKDNLSNYDAIIVHGLWLYPGYAVNKALKLLHGEKQVPKLFVMPHGMLDPYFQKARGRKLKAIRNNIYWKLVECKLIQQANALLFTCSEEKRLARQPFSPYFPNQEAVVGLGVEAPPLYQEAMRKAFIEKCPGIEGEQYLLYIGRIDEKKGIDLLVSGYIEILEEYTASKKQQTSSHDFEQSKQVNFPTLVIAGPGIDSAFGRKIKQQAAGYESQIFFPGMLLGDAKWGAFYGCDASVLPSHQENFGIAVAESLACGKPVLISTQVNIWRDIKESGAGLVSPDTKEGIKKILYAWIGLAGEKKLQIVNNARRCFETKFSSKTVSNTLIEYL
jgi:glycosyltransferase involved in cell wall biosynthesis